MRACGLGAAGSVTPSRGLEVERTVILLVVCDARCRWDPSRSLDPESSTLDCAEHSGSTVEHR